MVLSRHLQWMFTKRLTANIAPAATQMAKKRAVCMRVCVCMYVCMYKCFHGKRGDEGRIFHLVEEKNRKRGNSKIKNSKVLFRSKKEKQKQQSYQKKILPRMN